MKALRIVTKIFVYIAMAASLFMLGLVFLDVILRIFFRAPIVGATELSQMAMVCILPAMGGVILENRNTKVDVLVEKFPPKLALGVDVVTLVISIAYCALLGWQTIESSIFSKEFKVVYSLLRVPEWPFLVLLGCAFFVAAIATFVFMINRIRTRNQPAEEHMPELDILEEADDK